jgi:hypothetical protein
LERLESAMKPSVTEPNRWLPTWRLGWRLLLMALVGAPSLRAADDADAKKTEAPPEPGAAKAAQEEPAQEKEKKAEEPAEDEDAATYTHWLDLGVGGLILDGDRARFQQRHQVAGGPFGGIEDFHWETQVGKKTYFEVDGRAVFDTQDFALRYDLVRPDVGYVRGGFKQYTTYYDGSGGFYPAGGAWIALEDDALELDRGEVWIEGGLTLPKKPVITFRYTHQYRVGYKNSTSWADSNLTAPGGRYASPVNLRGFAPAFWDIDERRHLFQGDVKHKIGKTDVGLGVRYEMSDVDNALKGTRRPLEGPELQRQLTSRQAVESDILNARAYTETRLNEKTRFSFGYSFTSLDTDLAGSRIYGDGYDVGYRRDRAYAQGYYALAGGSQMDQNVFHANLMTTPWTNITVVPSLRVETLNLDSLASYVLTDSDDARPAEAVSERSLVDIAERLELRYTGMTNWVLYARGDWSQAQGDLAEKGGNGPTLSYPGVDRVTDDSRFTQKYTVGANWYPLPRLNLDLQYYFKNRQNEYDTQRDSTANHSPDRYPAFFRLQEFTTDDVNCRLTFRPFANLTLVSRYDFQYSRTLSAPDYDSGLGESLDAITLSHIFGQSVTWIPWSRLYLQGSLNYAKDETDTPADQYSAATADSRNDYWTASVTSGFVLDNKTDLQLNYFFFHANNFLEHLDDGQPYGTDAEEHGLTVTLARKINKHLRLTLKYGFFHYRDSATDGHDDYNAHLIYSGLHYRF